jgi:glycosyltransferase involved in cell wall biosynthesis
MMKRKIRVLFVRPSTVHFIEQDLAILSRHFDVKVLNVSPEGRTLSAGMRYLFKLKWGILRSDVAFCWFADIYSEWSVRLARWLGKKSIVVVGGYEVAKIPEINYGLMLNEDDAKMVRHILDKADKLLAVSDFVKKEIEQYSHGKNVSVVYNAVDVAGLTPRDKKEDLVVTVGNATKERCALKGIDTFVKASLQVPNARFVVIGGTDDETVKRLKEINPKVEFTGQLPHDEAMVGDIGRPMSRRLLCGREILLYWRCRSPRKRRQHQCQAD